MAREFSHGQMDVGMRATLSKTRERVKVLCLGQMGENMRVDGSMEDNTVMVSS